MKYITIILSIMFLEMNLALELFSQEHKLKLNKMYNVNSVDKVQSAKGASNRIYSKNKLNYVSTDEQPSTSKADLRKIELFNESNVLLGTSKPVDLYDRIIYPIGDGQTVLVVFPAGTFSRAIIDIYKLEGKNLIKYKKIEREVSSFNIDVSPNADAFICSFSRNEINILPEIICFKTNGDIIWTRNLNEKRVKTLFFAENNVVVATKDSDKKVGIVYLLSNSGEELLTTRLDDIKGSYNIEVGNHRLTRYFGLVALNHVYLFDVKINKLIDELSVNSGTKIQSAKVDDEGRIYVDIPIKPCHLFRRYPASLNFDFYG